MVELPIKIGKYGFRVKDTGEIIFEDLRARGVITDAPYNTSVFWLASLQYAKEDLAQDYGSLARITEGNWADMAIKARMNTYNDSAYMYGRHLDHRNWYATYTYYGESTKDHQIKKCVNGTISTIGTEAVDLGTGYWYWFELEIVGSTLKSYRAPNPEADVPDTPQISVTDTDIATGRWGIRHIGLGARGLHGLHWILLQPSSNIPEPLKIFRAPIEKNEKGEWQPKLPVEIKRIERFVIHDELTFNRMKRLLRDKFGLDVILALAEALGIITTYEEINIYAFSWDAVLPTPKGEPIDNECIVRIRGFPDINMADKIIEKLKELGWKEIEKDQAKRLLPKFDDKLHKYDVEHATESEAEKAKKEYKEWRESQFKVVMDDKIAEHYVKMRKGW